MAEHAHLKAALDEAMVAWREDKPNTEKATAALAVVAAAKLVGAISPAMAQTYAEEVALSTYQTQNGYSEDGARIAVSLVAGGMPDVLLSTPTVRDKLEEMARDLRGRGIALTDVEFVAFPEPDGPEGPSLGIGARLKNAPQDDIGVPLGSA